MHIQYIPLQRCSRLGLAVSSSSPFAGETARKISCKPSSGKLYRTTTTVLFFVLPSFKHTTIPGGVVATQPCDGVILMLTSFSRSFCFFVCDFVVDLCRTEANDPSLLMIKFNTDDCSADGIAVIDDDR